MARKRRRDRRPGIKGKWVRGANPYGDIVELGGVALTAEDHDRLWDEDDARTRAQCPEIAEKEAAFGPSRLAGTKRRLKPDILRDEFISPEGDVPVREVLNAAMYILEIVREAVAGAGLAGLFDYEHKILDQLIDLAAFGRTKLAEARDIADAYKQANELTAIYQETVDASRNQPRKRASNARPMAIQAEKIQAFLEKHGHPCNPRVIRQCLREPSTILQSNYAVHTANAVLHDLGVRSEGSLRKERGLVSETYLARVEGARLLDGVPADRRMEMAEKLAKFARAAYLAATSGPDSKGSVDNLLMRTVVALDLSRETGTPRGQSPYSTPVPASRATEEPDASPASDVPTPDSGSNIGR